MATSENTIKTNKRGMSLLECLVALSIMSISLTAIFMTIRTASAFIHHKNLETQALLLAETKLSESKLGELTTFEILSGKNGKFEWKVEITPTDCQILGLVKSQVSWTEQGIEKKVCLKTFIQMNSTD